MEFRIISGDSTGLYVVTERLAAHEAVSLFLSLATKVFADHIDNPVLTELTLNEWTNDPTQNMIFCGDRNGWKIGLVPAHVEDRLPSAN